METTVTIEPMSISHFSDNLQKRYSVSYSTTIPLEIPVQNAWEIVRQVISICFPTENVRLEALTEDLGQYRYAFSISSNTITPERKEVTISI